MNEQELIEALEDIACNYISAYDFFIHNVIDSRDEIDASVGDINKALKAAYELGLKEGVKEGNK